MTAIYSHDVPDDFFPELERVSDSLSDPGARCDPFDLLGVWMSESGMRHDAENPHGCASGIFQAMPATLRGFGFHGTDEQIARDFMALTATEQLAFALRYYGLARGRLTSAAACYLWTFIPNDIGLASDPNAVISAKRGSSVCPDGRRSNIFDVNSAFDDNHDLAIEVHELTDHIARANHTARAEEIQDRMREYLGLEPMGLTSHPVDVDSPADLHTLMGIQRALNALRFGPLDLDGIMGPHTLAAIRVFQGAHGLATDGIPGPNTRAALALALMAA